MRTMDDEYGDGSDCLVCEKCLLCITCGDCKKHGCRKDIPQPSDQPTVEQ